MNSPTAALSNESLGYLNYLHATMTQPPGEWVGFYRAQSPSMNFALRYQLAFATYALAAMAQRTPAYRAPYKEAMQAAIERMLDVVTWGYWRAPEPASGASQEHAGSGHVAVLLSPHQRVLAGPPSDPIVQNNLQYSGHLSTMLGLYEKVTGDTHYDHPFSLHDAASDVSYTYTHSEVAERIYRQMRDNRFGGVCCEPGMAYVPCNNYAMASNTLHDALHNTNYSAANGGWLETVRRKMLLHGPAVRGVFGASYMKDLNLATPVAFNFTDAWGMAFLVPFDRPLVKRLYGKFKKKVERAGRLGAFVGSSSVSEKMEISDVPVNTGFGAILAQGMGDVKLTEAFRRYAISQFGGGWDGPRYSLRGAPRTLHATSLFALAQALEPGGASFASLFTEPPVASHGDYPCLEKVLDPSGRVGVSRAEYSAQDRTLRLELRQVGEQREVGRKGPIDVELSLKNMERRPQVEINGLLVAEAGAELESASNGNPKVRVQVMP